MYGSVSDCSFLKQKTSRRFRLRIWTRVQLLGTPTPSMARERQGGLVLPKRRRAPLLSSIEAFTAALKKNVNKAGGLIKTEIAYPKPARGLWTDGQAFMTRADRRGLRRKPGFRCSIADCRASGL